MPHGVYNKKRDYKMRAATGEGCEKNTAAARPQPHFGN
jgi:hypothetical protein